MSVNSTRTSGRTNRRSDILRAAEKLMRLHGLSGVTTRQISEEAGCSEGALYVHFKGRLELLLAMLEQSLPSMLVPLEALRQSVGSGSPQENLVQALGGIFKFHQHIVSGTASLFAEPDLLAAYRNSLKRQGRGPHLSMRVLEEYILAEQQLGRIDSQVDAKFAACLMMASSFFRAFNEQFFGKPMQPAWNTFAEQLVVTVVPQPAASKRK
jgi:AcrR family transcriptional regulator